MSRTYTKNEIVKMVPGITGNMVKHYTEEGTVSPEPSTGQGTGHNRQYSHFSVFNFAVIAVLAKYSIKQKDIKKIIDYIKNNESPNVKNIIVEHNGILYVVNESEPIMLMLRWEDKEPLIDIWLGEFIVGNRVDSRTELVTQDVNKNLKFDDGGKPYTDSIILNLNTILRTITWYA